MELLFLEKRLREKQAGDSQRIHAPEDREKGDLLDFITPRNREIMERKIASLFREKTEAEE